MKKPRPPRTIGRKRRVAGWTLFAAGVAVAAVWAASRWYTFSVSTSSLGVNVIRGEVFMVGGKLYAHKPQVQPNSEAGCTWWFESAEELYDGTVRGFGVVRFRRTAYNPRESWTLRVLAWPVPLVVWVPAALLLRSGIIARRRARGGACVRCGYSLAGVVAGAPCPECGQ